MNTEKINIQSFEDVMKVNGTVFRKDFSDISDEKERTHQTAKWEWEEIVKAYNKQRDPEFKANPADHSQYKYYPFVSIVKDSTQPSGFAFSVTHYGCTYAITFVGSRLIFADSDDVIEALKKFGQTFIKYTIS